MPGGRATEPRLRPCDRNGVVTARPAPARPNDPPVPLSTVAREWLRMGLTGFGGPPAHVALLQRLVVDRERWMTAREFQDAYAACGLLPGPASTQLAIFCAYRVGGRRAAVVGGLGFVVPAVIIILLLSLVFLADAPPRWVRGAGAGAGAAVAAVALEAGRSLLVPGLDRVTGDRVRRGRWLAYVGAGVAATVLVGPWLVLVLLGCGLVELGLRRRGDAPLLGAAWAPAWLLGAAGAGATGGLGALAWTAFKVGALAYGGGFVIIPLMQGDAVTAHGWMTDAQFLNAVALGQVTPGPVVGTIAAVGYAAHGVGGALLAAAIAFAPSFTFVLLAGGRFEALRHNAAVNAFLDGAGPAAIGAILGAAVILALALREPWQLAVLAAAAVALLALRRGIVVTMLAAGAAGVVAALAGAPLP
jgi:chromate transporter